MRSYSFAHLTASPSRRRVGLPLFVLALLGSACASPKVDHQQEAHKVTAPPLPVQIAEVARTPRSGSAWVAGSVRPQNRASLAARYAGTARRLNFKLGSQVKKGQLLVELDALELEARYRQSLSQVQRLRVDLNRERRLLETGATTAVAVQNLESQLTLAEAQADETHTMMGYTRITAPFDGVVSRKSIELGALATPGTALLELEGFGPLEVEVMVPESLAQLQVGMPVSLSSAEDAPKLQAQVLEVAGAADNRTRTVQVRLQLPPDSQLKSGAYVQVELPGKASTALSIPEQALSPWGQVERVFAVENGRAQLRVVRVAKLDASRLEVLSGLELGEQVLLAPPPQLKDGAAVEVLK